jgi:hypothetical protein
MFVHRNAFTETGADSIDLAVDSHNTDLLRLEGGVELLTCFTYPKVHWQPHVLVAGVVENQFFGKRQTASFTSTHCPMTTAGLRDDQALLLVEAGLNASEESISVSANYRGEWGRKSQNLSWSLQARFMF